MRPGGAQLNPLGPDHGKLKSDSVDSRLLQEVKERPELPPAVGDHVMVLLKEKAQRIIDDDDDSSSED